MKYLHLKTIYDVDVIVNADHVAFAMPQAVGSANTVLTFVNGEKLGVTKPIGDLLLLLAAAGK